MDIHQTKKALHSEENHQKMKRRPTELEKIFEKHASDKGLMSTIYKELIHLNIRKQITQLKWAKHLKILQRRHIDT